MSGAPDSGQSNRLEFHAKSERKKLKNRKKKARKAEKVFRSNFRASILLRLSLMRRNPRRKQRLSK
jgi:hypothetical protein